MGMKYSLAAALLIAGIFGAAVDGFALEESKVMSLLVSEGYSSIWRVDQGDVTPEYGRWVTAYETPRQISDEVCAGREINLGVREATGAIVYKKVTTLVALRDCQETEPASFAHVSGNFNDNRLAGIAHAIAGFLKTQTGSSPRILVTFQDDAARDLAKVASTGQLQEIVQSIDGQVWATVETKESMPRHLRIDLSFDNGFLQEIRASEAFLGVLR
jgi:hypothetical protein